MDVVMDNNVLVLASSLDLHSSLAHFLHARQSTELAATVVDRCLWQPEEVIFSQKTMSTQQQKAISLCSKYTSEQNLDKLTTTLSLRSQMLL